MILTLEMSLDNDAFHGDLMSIEVSGILQNLGKYLGAGNLNSGDNYPVMDTNGNTIGWVKITEREITDGNS